MGSLVFLLFNLAKVAFRCCPLCVYPSPLHHLSRVIQPTRPPPPLPHRLLISPNHTRIVKANCLFRFANELPIDSGWNGEYQSECFFYRSFIRSAFLPLFFFVCVFFLSWWRFYINDGTVISQRWFTDADMKSSKTISPTFLNEMTWNYIRIYARTHNPSGPTKSTLLKWKIVQFNNIRFLFFCSCRFHNSHRSMGECEYASACIRLCELHMDHHSSPPNLSPGFFFAPALTLH